MRELVDGDGTIRARYEYSPYGERTKISGDLDADFGFTGHYTHEASGIILALYRGYDPTTARWLSRDPIEEDGGINLYGYVGNRPTILIDPFGWDGVIYVDSTIRGNNSKLINNITYLAEKEPGNPEPPKQYRRLPMGGCQVKADAIYFPDGTAWKIPDSASVTLSVLNGKFVVKKSEPLSSIFDRCKISEWKLGNQPPPRWPTGDSGRGNGPYTHPPYKGTPPVTPLPPLAPDLTFGTDLGWGLTK